MMYDLSVCVSLWLPVSYVHLRRSELCIVPTSLMAWKGSSSWSHTLNLFSHIATHSLRHTRTHPWSGETSVGYSSCSFLREEPSTHDQHLGPGPLMIWLPSGCFCLGCGQWFNFYFFLCTFDACVSACAERALCVMLHHDVYERARRTASELDMKTSPKHMPAWWKTNTQASCPKI